MNERATLLITLLDERFGMALGEAAARDTISDHVDHVAMVMRIGRQAAKVYVTDEVMSDMADRIGSEVNRQRAARGEKHLKIVR